MKATSSLEFKLKALFYALLFIASSQDVIIAAPPPVDKDGQMKSSLTNSNQMDWYQLDNQAANLLAGAKDMAKVK